MKSIYFIGLYFFLISVEAIAGSAHGSPVPRRCQGTIVSSTEELDMDLSHRGDVMHYAFSSDRGSQTCEVTLSESLVKKAAISPQPCSIVCKSSEWKKLDGTIKFSLPRKLEILWQDQKENGYLLLDTDSNMKKVRVSYSSNSLNSKDGFNGALICW